MKTKSLLLVGLFSALAPTAALAQKTSSEDITKPRVIITCDPELDDNNSLIRFLLFSTDFRVEGLIYSSSKFHWKGDGLGTKQFIPNREYDSNGRKMGPQASWRWDPNERFIDAAVDAYTEAYPNLKIHDASYPTPEYLKSKVCMGNVEFDGDISKDTPGSEMIKSVFLDDKPGLVYVNAWGGGSSIARALKSIEEIYSKTPQWNAIREKIIKKTVLCLSGDQDDTYAKYVGPFWPELRQQQMGGMTVGLAYNCQERCPESDKVFYSPEWMQENILSKGPFGKLQRVWGDGKQMVKGDIYDYFGLSGYSVDELKKQGYVVWTPVLQKKGAFLAEGDTYCFLNYIGNGLRGGENLTNGGWCGAKMEIPADVQKKGMMEVMKWRSEHNTLPDFTPAVMNGLAARFKWTCTANYKDANHYPVIQGPLDITAAPGEKLKMKYTVTDPDKDALTIKWWQYKSGPYKGDTNVDNPISANTTYTVPTDAKPGDKIHLVLEATDNGTPQLNMYHRVIITVK